MLARATAASANRGQAAKTNRFHPSARLDAAPPGDAVGLVMQIEYEVSIDAGILFDVEYTFALPTRMFAT